MPKNMKQSNIAAEQEPRIYIDKSYWPAANISAEHMNDPFAKHPDHGTPSIVLAFHGMLSFLNYGKKSCDVGIHTSSSDHRFFILVQTPTTFSLYSIEDPKSLGTDISFQVEEPKVPDVSYFQDQDVFSRRKPIPGAVEFDHPHDFRWLIDLDGPEFHDSKLTLKDEMLTPRILLNNGIFYTHSITDNTFDREAPGDKYYMGSVARAIMANVYLDGVGYADLFFGTQALRLKPGKDETYYVGFFNNCLSANCNFDPDSPRKERRNDFHHYYRTFEIPHGQKEYELKINHYYSSPTTPAATTPPPLSSMSLEGLAKKPFLEILNQLLGADFAPCGGGGNSGK